MAPDLGIAFDVRLVVVGFAIGRIPEIAANRMLLRTFSVTGFTLHAYKKHRPDLLQQAQQHLFQLYSEGRIRPVISHRLPLEQLVRALELAEGSGPGEAETLEALRAWAAGFEFGPSSSTWIGGAWPRSRSRWKSRGITSARRALPS